MVVKRLGVRLCQIDLDDIMKRFVEWELDDEYKPFGEAFDQGNTCSNAIYRYMDTHDASSCGENGEHANGKGALMRILPACLYYYNLRKGCDKSLDDEAINGIHMVGGLTHNHIRFKICCGIYYSCFKSILDARGSKGASLSALLQCGIDTAVRYYSETKANVSELDTLKRIFNLDVFKAELEDTINPTGYVVESMEAAIWCLINTASYKDCMLLAVNLGDDTDTIAAIAGGLAGLYYGYGDIPRDWLEVISRREWIEGMCQHFVDASKIDVKVVDIHSHILPEVDDGAERVEISKQMIKLSYEQGCRHLFLTPHAVHYDDDNGEILSKLDVLRNWTVSEGMYIGLFLVAEVYIDLGYEDIDVVLGKLASKKYPTLNATRHVLIEFDLGGFVLDEALETMEALIREGYIPVVAHAERYGARFDELCQLKRLGCKLQMNLCDLYRIKENDINQLTHMLLREKTYDFVGTDVHSMDRRAPYMKEYIDYLYRNYDNEYVDGILYANAKECLGLA